MSKCTTAAILLMLSCNALAQVYRVDKDTSARPGDHGGQTWDTAYNAIQEAVDAASAAGGGEVWVAEGTYTDTNDPIVQMLENVHLYGGFVGIGTGGNETQRDQQNGHCRHQALPPGLRFRIRMRGLTTCLVSTWAGHHRPDMRKSR